MPFHGILWFVSLYPSLIQILHVRKLLFSVLNENQISLQMAQSYLKMLICLIFMMCLKLNVFIWVQQGKQCPLIYFKI